MAFTAVFQKVPDGYIGFVEELPGANTQGSTLMEANRKPAAKTIVNRDVIREKIEIID